MKVNVMVLGVLLLLICPVFGQTVPAPPSQPETTSIESLLNSVRELTKEVQSLRQDLQEVKGQLQDSFNNSAMKTLLFLSAFFLSFYAFTRILSRFYGWWAYRGKKREMDDLTYKMSSSLKAVIGELGEFKLAVIEMKETLATMESQVAELRYHVGVDKPKKSGLVDKLMFWVKK